MKYKIRKLAFYETVEFEQYYMLYSNNVKNSIKYYKIREIEEWILFAERIIYVPIRIS